MTAVAPAVVIVSTPEAAETPGATTIRIAPGADPAALAIGPRDRVIVSSRLPLFYLHALIRRSEDGLVGDVRLLIDGAPPDPSAIGFRHRPWLREIWMSRPPAESWSPHPAPVRHVADLAVALRTLGPVPVAFAETASAWPSVVQIQTVSGCRATCPWCPIGPVSPEERQMSEPVWRGLLEELARTPPDMAELFFHAEPLLDPALERRSDELASACPDALLSIVTHESALTVERARSLAAGSLDVVFVSLNVCGQPPEARLRSRLGPLVAIADVLRGAGKALVVTTLGNFLRGAVRGRFRRLCAELGLTTETFHATSRAGDVAVERWTGGPVRRHRGVCPRPFFKAYVRVDGQLALCCEDWRYRVPLGRLAPADRAEGRSLAELWTAPAYERVRAALLGRGVPAAPCLACDYRG